MASHNTFSWQTSLTDTYEAFSSQIIAFVPQLAGALALLVAGWLVAYGLRISTRKLVRGLDSLFPDAARAEALGQARMKRSYAVIISNIVFWVVIVFFVATAANMLGWKMVSNWVDSIIIYLPNLVTGLLIILAGFLLGNFGRSGIVRAASSAGMEQAEILARVVQVVIIFTTLIIGIEQIGINVDFLTNVLIVIVGVLLAGAALAFGLGARTLIANIIGAQYLRKHCRIGEQIKIGDTEGILVDVTQTSMVVETANGRTVIPAKQFQEQASNFMSASEASGETTVKPATKKAKS